MKRAGGTRTSLDIMKGIGREAALPPAIRLFESLRAQQEAALPPAIRLFESLRAQQEAALPPAIRLFESLRAQQEAALPPAIRLFESLRAQQEATLPPAIRLFESLRAQQEATLPPAIRLFESLRAQQEATLPPAIRLFESLRAQQEATLPPAIRLFESLSAELARTVEPWRGAFASVSDWEASLTVRMATLQTPWALRDCLDQSVIGFAHLSRLSDAVHTEEPYSELVGELVADELGDGVEAEEQDDSPTAHDTAAIEAGLNPDLIAFPPSAYREVVSAAGFTFRLPPLPVPQAVESADPNAVFDPTHWRVLTELEQQLRNIVEKRLSALHGEKWLKRRIPEEVHQRWLKRQEKDRQDGQSVYPPIQYADFMDLAAVIGRADNWREVFEPIFRNQDDLMVSFHRLQPIRNSIAHSRPLGRFHVLTLVSEATRIFNILGIPVLN